MGVYAEDPSSHPYINTYVHSNNEFGQTVNGGYTDQLISSSSTADDINNHHHRNLVQHHQSEITTDDGSGYHPSYADSTVIHNGITDEIIVQATDGQFYRQIQNVYVNGDDANTAATTQVEFFPMIADYLTENDHHQYYQQQQYEMDDAADFEQQQQQQQCSIIDPEKMNEVILVPNSSSNNSVMECHVELMTAAANQNQYYKNEYTVLEPMTNQQMIQRHSEQQQELVAGLQPINTVPIPIVDEKEQHRLLLETKISPLLAAVNDITSRDEQFQLYLAQHQIDDTNDHDVYQQHNNSGGVNEDENAATSSTSISETTQVSMIKTNQQSASVAIDTNYHLTTTATTTDNGNGKIMSSALHSSNEYVDINEFVANRSQHYNGVIMDCDQSAENLLQRRSQRKIQKNTNECKSL